MKVNRRLRRAIEREGYELVNRRWAAELRSRDWRNDAARRRESEWWNERQKLNDRIFELEAMIEGHKRVEAELAHRVVEASR